MLKDANFMSIADRSILACWGVKGGKAGRSFQVTVDLGGPEEREVDALADSEPVGRPAHPDPHDRRRRLGRPADAPVRRGRARPALGQGLGRGRASDYGVVARHRRTVSTRPRTRCASSCGPPRPRSRSSTAARATPGWPRARLRPTSTGSDHDGCGEPRAAGASWARPARPDAP